MSVSSGARSEGACLRCPNGGGATVAAGGGGVLDCAAYAVAVKVSVSGTKAMAALSLHRQLDLLLALLQSPAPLQLRVRLAPDTTTSRLEVMARLGPSVESVGLLQGGTVLLQPSGAALSDLVQDTLAKSSVFRMTRRSQYSVSLAALAALLASRVSELFPGASEFSVCTPSIGTPEAMTAMPVATGCLAELGVLSQAVPPLSFHDIELASVLHDVGQAALAAESPLVLSALTAGDRRDTGEPSTFFLSTQYAETGMPSVQPTIAVLQRAVNQALGTDALVLSESGLPRGMERTAVGSTAGRRCELGTFLGKDGRCLPCSPTPLSCVKAVPAAQLPFYQPSECMSDRDAGCEPCPQGVCMKRCGDGVKEADEECDPEMHAEQCCTHSCELRAGWTLTPESTCTPIFGDGMVVAGAELCDDSNTRSGDGCSERGIIEYGYVCPTPGRPCLCQICQLDKYLELGQVAKLNYAGMFEADRMRISAGGSAVFHKGTASLYATAAVLGLAVVWVWSIRYV